MPCRDDEDEGRNCNLMLIKRAKLKFAGKLAPNSIARLRSYLNVILRDCCSSCPPCPPSLCL